MIRAMLRAILFDFNGVLVDDEPVHLELFQEIFRREGVEVSSADYYARLIGLDDRGCFRTVLEEAGQAAGPERLAELIARKSALYDRWVRERGFPFFPGAAELVADVAGELALGVVSGALRGEVEAALEELGVRRHFRSVVAAEDVAAAKPDPEGYRRGLELLNSRPPRPAPPIAPRETLAIEDTPAGLAAAAAAGLATLGVAQTCPAVELASADRVVESVSGLDRRRLQSWFA